MLQTPLGAGRAWARNPAGSLRSFQRKGRMIRRSRLYQVHAAAPASHAQTSARSSAPAAAVGPPGSSAPPVGPGVAPHDYSYAAFQALAGQRSLPRASGSTAQNKPSGNGCSRNIAGSQDIVTREAVATDQWQQRPQGPFCRLEEGRYWADTPFSTGFPLPTSYAERRLWSQWPPPAGPTTLPRRRRSSTTTITAPRQPAAQPAPAPAADPCHQKQAAAAGQAPSQPSWQQQQQQQPTWQAPQPGSRSRGTNAAAPPAPPRRTHHSRQPPPQPATMQHAQVVFRAAPYAAELARQRQHKAVPRILFVDEGQSCRAVLAEAVMQLLLSKLALPLEVEVASASIGEPTPGPEHDPRVAGIARAMALPLSPQRHPRAFDEVEDAVQQDLIIVMDAFDHQEVVRDVAVLDTINPGGCYASRVRQLCSFAPAATLALRPHPEQQPAGQLLQAPPDIPDPLYGTLSGVEEAAALRATVHQLTVACKGLLYYLLLLRRSCLRSSKASSASSTALGASLRQALAQSLQCPALAPEVLQARHRLAAAMGRPGQQRAGLSQPQGRRPVWQSQADGQLYTLRRSREGSCTTSSASSSSGGQAAGTLDCLGSLSTRLVPGQAAGTRPHSAGGRQWQAGQLLGYEIRRSGARPRGYWQDIGSVEQELRAWMQQHGILDRLPTQRELRDSGANALSAAVGRLGGLRLFAERLHLSLTSRRRPNGFWDSFDNLQAELEPYLDPAYLKRQQRVHSLQQQQQLAAEAGQRGAGGIVGQWADNVGTEELQLEEECQPLLHWDWASGEEQGEEGLPVSSSCSSPGTFNQAELLQSEEEDWQVLVDWDWSSDEEQGEEGLPGRTSSSWGCRNGSSSSSSSRSRSSSRSSSSHGGSAAASTCRRVFPTHQQLLAAGRADLVRAIRTHGGSKQVARQLSAQAARGALLVPQPLAAEVGAAVLQFLESQGWAEQRMPARWELQGLGRSDLWAAIQRAGGAQHLAELLGLQWQESRGRKSRARAGRAAVQPAAAGQVATTAPQSESDWEQLAYTEFVLV